VDAPPVVGYFPGVDAHRLAEERSIALHAAIAECIVADDTIVPRARARVEGWLRDGPVHPEYARQWLQILDLPTGAMIRALVDPSDRARALRQVTPFSFVIPARERWAIWRAVRERVGITEREARG
jgi:hypothetical protein